MFILLESIFPRYFVIAIFMVIFIDAYYEDFFVSCWRRALREVEAVKTRRASEFLFMLRRKGTKWKVDL